VPVVVDEHDAVGVIDFMLEYSCQEAFGSNAKFFAVLVDSFYTDFCVSRDLTVDIFNTQTTFKIFFDGTFEFSNFRIDKDRKTMVILVIIIVADDNDFIEAVDLHRR
jgi:hypothetical protein